MCRVRWARSISCGCGGSMWRRRWRGHMWNWTPLYLGLKGMNIISVGFPCLPIRYLLLVLLLEEKRYGHHHRSLHRQDLRASNHPLNPRLLWKAHMLEDMAQESWHQKWKTLSSNQALTLDLVFKMHQGGHHQLRGTKPVSL